jgi:3'-phosphoadenosine 5'-phosphosulfate sulfotransferase
MVRTTLVLAVIAVVMFAPPAMPVETVRQQSAPVKLERWQAMRVVKANARMQRRDELYIARTERLSPRRIRVCWRDPDDYIGLPGEVDVGCDRVELRGREFWLYDDSMLGLGWRRWL